MKFHPSPAVRALALLAALAPIAAAQQPTAYWTFDRDYSSVIDNNLYRGAPTGSISISPAARVGAGALRIDDSGNVSSAYTLGVDTAQSNFTFGGTSSLGPIQGTPNTFQLGGSADMDLQPPRGPLATGQFLSGSLSTVPTTITARVPNIFSWLPPLATLSISNAVFSIDSPSFAIQGTSFTADIVLTPISGLVQITPLIGSPTTIDLSTAGPSSPSQVTGSISIAAGRVQVSIPINNTFNLSSGSLTASVWLNGTAQASAPLNSPGANFLDITNRVIQPGQSALTITGWYRYADLAGNGSRAENTIWETSDPSASPGASGFALAGARARAQWVINDTAAGHFQGDNGTPDDGQWHHVALTWSKSAREIVFYWDGNLVARRATTGADLESTDGLHIGAGHQADGSQGFDGFIDDLAVFDGALSAHAIAGLFDGSFAILSLPYGSGCHGAAIHSQGQPLLGNAAFAITLVGAPPSSPAALGLGTSDTTWAGLALPFDLGGLGAPGCWILASQLASFSTSTDAAGAAAMPMPIPAIPYFGGIELFAQWTVFSPPANALATVSSDGLSVTLQP